MRDAGLQMRRVYRLDPYAMIVRGGLGSPANSKNRTSAGYDMFAARDARRGFAAQPAWSEKLSRDWRIERDVDPSVRVPALMIPGVGDDVLHRGMTTGMGAPSSALERRVIAGSTKRMPSKRADAIGHVALEWLKRWPVL